MKKKLYGGIIHCRKFKVFTLCRFWGIKILNVCRTLWTPCILSSQPIHENIWERKDKETPQNRKL